MLLPLIVDVDVLMLPSMMMHPFVSAHLPLAENRMTRMIAELGVKPLVDRTNERRRLRCIPDLRPIGELGVLDPDFPWLR